MKIYTKAGDKGTTSLIGGKRVPKDNSQVEAYGTVDELISHIGLIRDQAIDNSTRDYLLLIQDKLMICATILATDNTNKNNIKKELQDKDIIGLEEQIDVMSINLPELTSLLLPGGHQTISYCHIARTICRRAERRVTNLNNKNKNKYEMVIKLLNRLSDYLFILARKMAKDLGIDEISWK